MARTKPRAGRRDNRTGSYRFRSAKRPCAIELCVRDPETGERRFRTVKGVADDDAARRELARFVAEVVDGKVAAKTGRRTVEIVCREWLDRQHERARSGQIVPGTVAKSQAMVRHIIREVGRKRIDQLKVTDLEDLYNVRLPSRLGARTISDLAGVMYQVLQYALRRDYVRVNVAALVEERPRVADRDDEPPQDADLRSYLEAAQEKDWDLFAYLLAAAASGARREEMLGLRPKDVLLDSGELWFRLTVSKRGHARDLDGNLLDGPPIIVRPRGKTPAARRRVQVPDGVVAVLREHLRRLDEKARELGMRRWPADGFIFTAEPPGGKGPWLIEGAEATGRPLYPDTVNNRMERLSLKTGIHVTPHQLRHYAATVVAPFLTETEMQGRFGWKDSRMVRRYAHYRQARDAVASAALGQALGLTRSDAASEA
ncbi:MAG TPA: site-specific integrase [Actinomycetota bacterium]|nr:site-specific integrase [Actinomycetota bacterium]